MSKHGEERIRCAAVAGWWTLLVALGLFIVDWLLYLLVVPARPSFVLKAWGPGSDWDQVQTLWFWFLAGYKVLLVLVAFVLLWVTLWGRELRKVRQPLTQP